MNERIRQLAEQAGYEPDMFGIGHWDMPECKKFAELIIQECIDHIDYRTQDWDANLHWIFNDGSGYMEVNVDSILKDHFNYIVD
jgi:hypothetical protein